MTVKDTMISMALTQLHTSLHRIYEIWLEVGNGDMSVLEARMDEARDEFMARSSKYLTEQEQTRFFVRAYEDTLIAVMNAS